MAENGEAPLPLSPSQILKEDAFSMVTQVAWEDEVRNKKLPVVFIRLSLAAYPCLNSFGIIYVRTHVSLAVTHVSLAVTENLRNVCYQLL